MMRPRCSTVTGGFDFSGCGDFTSCPPVGRAEMSNSEPSTIVLHGMTCIGGLYISFDSNGENGSLFDLQSAFAATTASSGSYRPVFPLPAGVFALSPAQRSAGYVP